MREGIARPDIVPILLDAIAKPRVKHLVVSEPICLVRSATVRYSPAGESGWH